MHRLILTFIFISTLTNVISAQNVRFYAKTDAKEVFLNSYINMSYVLENNDGKNFTPPNFKGFKIISGPNNSSQISIINGNKSSKYTYSYTLLAIKPGQFIIKPATIRVDRKTLKTKPIIINVKKGGKKITNGLAMKEKFFIKQEFSDSIAYPGQQIVLNYVLYTSVNVSNYNFRYRPDYEGFISKQINHNNNIERKIINGIEYSIYILEAVALFPQKAGSIKIEPANIVLNIPDKRNRNSFFRSTRPFPITGEKVTLIVKALPDNAPENFSGNIGKFNIRTQIKRKNISTDDAASLLLQINGDGLSKFITAPNLKKNFKDFEVYDPKVVRQREYISEGKLQSQKTFEYLLVPLKKGKYSIDIPFIYFDTDSSKYITLHSNPGLLNIRQGSNTKDIDSKKIIEKYQLRPINEAIELKTANIPFYGSWLYWTFLSLIILIIPILYFYKKHLIKIGNIDPILIKQKKANKEALKRLKKAKALMDNNEKAQFYKEISDTLLKYVSDKLNLPNIELSKSNVSIKLHDLGVTEDKNNTFISLITTCEVALYAGSPNSELKSIFSKTQTLLTDLEVSLNSKSVM